jgi:hypothetical protein
MPAGLELGIDHLTVDLDFEAPAIRGSQGDRFDLGFKIFEQIGC